MSEHLLDAAQVRSAFHQIGREGVAHVMGMQARIEARLGRALLEDATQAIGGHRVATRGDEQGAAAAVPQKNGTRLVDVAPHGLECERVKRDDALLGSFAEEPHARIGEVDVAKLEARYFGDAGTACVQELEKGLIANADRIVRADLEQLRDIGRYSSWRGASRVPTWARMSRQRD